MTITAQAVILVEDANKTKITVDFNPSDYSISFTPKYNEKSSAVMGKPSPEFNAEGKEVLSVTLTLDGFAQGRTLEESKAKDISPSIQALRALVKIDDSKHHPPHCTFQWGSMNFGGFVTGMDAQFTMFSSEGKLLRATVKLSITARDTSKNALQSPDRTRRRVQKQDVPLYLLAYEAYEDCSQWRTIAIANGIRNPRKTEPGVMLKIPPLVQRP